jgi:RNA polymerase primary sigma factor
VLWIARRYQNRGLELMDLIQEGNIGLLKAIEKYDQARGFAFTTYATWWVRQSITRIIADQGATIRIPVHRQEVVTRVARRARAFLSQHGREATAEELAAALDLPVGPVAVAMSLTFEMFALDEPLTPGARLLAETLSDAQASWPDKAVFSAELRARCASALRSLLPREERIIRLRFGMDVPSDRTLEEVGDAMGVTRERIRQIESKALRKLKHPSRSRRLRSLVDG